MNRWTFTIDGPLRGYRKDVAYSHSRGYKTWKAHVRLLANVAGVPDDPEGLVIRVWLYWAKRTRIDGKNMLGSIEDALWTQDRQLVEGSYRNVWDEGREYAVVVVERDVESGEAK